MTGAGSAGDRAPRIVEDRSVELSGAARSMLGGRLAECRRDVDRGVRITVVDLTDADVAALRDVAARLGVAAWTRIERADPADLAAWAGLRQELVALAAERPRVLRQYPTPETAYQRPPVLIRLDADERSVAVAARLHERYGTYLELHVGALRYPPDAVPPATQNRPEPTRDPVDPDELTISLDGSLMIGSGDSVTHGLILHNRSGDTVSIDTNGSVTAVVVDPGSGAPVGGFVGMQTQPLVRFRADPDQTVRIPLLVGTAGYAPEIGYSIPAGTWQLIAPLDLGDGRRLVSGRLDFTITL